MELAERIQRGRRAIVLANRQGRDTAKWHCFLNELLATAGNGTGKEDRVEPWPLWQWRRECIPEWQKKLETSIEIGDREGEEYARWMLREILLDPEYPDPDR